MPTRFRVWGDYALFTRPEMKTERVSFDIITPSAARGICEEGLCRQFAGGQEVPFDYSTFCSYFCPSSPTGTFHPENQDVTMVATAT